jgi:hypothetical protein
MRIFSIACDWCLISILLLCSVSRNVFRKETVRGDLYEVPRRENSSLQNIKNILRTGSLSKCPALGKEGNCEQETGTLTLQERNQICFTERPSSYRAVNTLPSRLQKPIRRRRMEQKALFVLRSTQNT